MATEPVTDFRIPFAVTWPDYSGGISPASDGAFPDTGADNTSKINSFYISKKRIEFDQGTYKADINPWSGMILEGRGKGQTIIEANSTDFLLPFTGETDIVFRNLTLRGFGALLWQNSGARYTFDNCAIDYGIYGFTTNADPASVTPSPGITISGLRVLNCDIGNMTGAASKLPCVIDGAWFINNNVHDIVGGGRIVGGFQMGLDGASPTTEQWEAQNSVFVHGNRFANFNNTTKTGSSAPGNNYELFGVVVKGRRASIIGNAFQNIQGVKLDNETIYSKCQEVDIIGNVMVDCGSTEGAINIKGNAYSEARGDLFTCTNNIIKFTTYTVDGQDLERSGIHTSNHKGVVANNVIQGANANGITVEGEPVNYQDVRVIGNVVTDHIGQFGYQFRGGYDRFMVSGNSVDFGTLTDDSTNFVGMAFQPAGLTRGTGLNDVLVSDNIIRMSSSMTLSGTATATGFRVTANLPINQMTIKGGIIDIDPALPSAYTIQMVVGDDGTFDDVQIMDVLMPNATSMDLLPANRFRMRQTITTTTTDNTTATAFFLPMAEGSVLSFKTKTTAATVASTDCAYYERVALFQRYTSAAPAQVGTTQTPITIEDVAGAWSSDFDITTVGGRNDVRVRIAGDAAQTVTWRTVLEVETLT